MSGWNVWCEAHVKECGAKAVPRYRAKTWMDARALKVLADKECMSHARHYIERATAPESNPVKPRSGREAE